jgi:hypothetical protein
MAGARSGGGCLLFFKSYGVAVCGWVFLWAVYVYIVCIHIAPPRLKIASQPAIKVFIQNQWSSGFRLANGGLGLGHGDQSFHPNQIAYPRVECGQSATPRKKSCLPMGFRGLVR